MRYSSILLGLLLVQPVSAQWWETRDVPKKAIWHKIKENKGTVILVPGANSEVENPRRNVLTQCYDVDPKNIRKFWSLRIPYTSGRVERYYNSTSIKFCTIRTKTAGLFMFIAESWIDLRDCNANTKFYLDTGKTLEITYCVREELPKPLPHILTVDTHGGRVKEGKMFDIQTCTERPLFDSTRIMIQLIPDTATEDDYSAIPPIETLIAKDHRISQIYNINTVQDSLFEGDEQFRLRFHLPQGFRFSDPIVGDCL